MRIKDGFMLRQVGATRIIIAIGAAARDFHAIAHVNTSGAIIFSSLKEGKTVEDIAYELTNTFKVDFDHAKSDVLRFAEQLVKSGIAY